MATTFNVFYLGNFSSIDVFEYDDNADNASALVGVTSGSFGAPLYENVHSFSPGSTGYSAGIIDGYDQDNSWANDAFSIDGGADQIHDATAVYNATVTYSDGTTGTLTAVVFQDTSGNAYLAPEISNNADQTVLEAKPIISLTLDSIDYTTTGGLHADRAIGDYMIPDGTVSGSSGNDLIDGAYVDPDGDVIDGFDGNHDSVLAGDGNDTVYGLLGDDTIHGETGDDSLDGGLGDDVITGGDGDDSLAGGAGSDYLNAGGGTDLLDYSASDGAVTVDLLNNTATGGHATGDTIAGFDDVIGSGFGDSLLGYDNTYDGSATSNIMDGAAGDDTIDGRGGDDSLIGGTGNDSLLGGAGSDTLEGGSGADTLIGGAGDDYLSGGADSDVFVLSDAGGSDTISDFATGDQIDSSALTDIGNATTNQNGLVTANEVLVTGGGGFDQVLTFPNGETVTVPDGTVDMTDGDSQFASLVAMGVPPCFASGTAILTVRGARRVEDLRVGDLVITADHGPQPLRWIGRRHEDFTDPANSRGSKDKPIEIKAGALGQGLPKRDLVVSPLHRMLIGGQLGPAKSLCVLPGVRRMEGCRKVVYHALLLDRHEIIFAEGAPSESFRPGPVVLRTFSQDQITAIEAYYPGLRERPYDALGPPARPLLRACEMRALIGGMHMSPNSKRPRTLARPFELS